MWQEINMCMVFGSKSSHALHMHTLSDTQNERENEVRNFIRKVREETKQGKWNACIGNVLYSPHMILDSSMRTQEFRILICVPYVSNGFVCLFVSICVFLSFLFHIIRMFYKLLFLYW